MIFERENRFILAKREKIEENEAAVMDSSQLTFDSSSKGCGRGWDGGGLRWWCVEVAKRAGRSGTG